MTTDFEQGSYTDPKNLPKSSNLYYIKAGFIFKDEDLAQALSTAWKQITLDVELPPAYEAKAMKKSFAEYLMNRKNRSDFATTGQRHNKRTKKQAIQLYNYAITFITLNWGTQVEPFGKEC